MVREFLTTLRPPVRVLLTPSLLDRMRGMYIEVQLYQTGVRIMIEATHMFTGMCALCMCGL